MLVFAWILWSLIVLYSIIRMSIFVGVVCAANDKNVTFHTSITRILIRTAALVFLSILIFGGYLA